jgi:hypothetical protein
MWGGVWTESKIQERPVAQTEFEGLPLATTESDLLFSKGAPQNRSNKEQWVFFANPGSTQPEFSPL